MKEHPRAVSNHLSRFQCQLSLRPEVPIKIGSQSNEVESLLNSFTVSTIESTRSPGQYMHSSTA